jgi:glycosyltransferase involved in cell wall biosynthesis
MRIGVIAPIEIRVPPVRYGGTELVVHLLTEELHRRGHDVTLFASGDSVTRARLTSVAPTPTREHGRDSSPLSVLNVANALGRSEEFDFLHNHTPWEGMALAGLSSTPMLTTIHGPPEGDAVSVFHRYRGWFNTVSRSAYRQLGRTERFAGVVYNAIDVARYPFVADPRDAFLLYLSRISPQKGPEEAIRIARAVGLPLRMAGAIHPNDRAYFRDRIEPHLDGERVQYLGEVDFDEKVALLTRARCLLAPIQWSEPFGLFMVEAMACGTPVVAYREGAAPELVRDGESGFVVDTFEEFVAKVAEVEHLDPRTCRRHVAEYFDYPRMVDEYLRAYRRILDAERPPPFDAPIPERAETDLSPIDAR